MGESYWSFNERYYFVLTYTNHFCLTMGNTNLKPIDIGIYSIPHLLELLGTLAAFLVATILAICVVRLFQARWKAEKELASFVLTKPRHWLLGHMYLVSVTVIFFLLGVGGWKMWLLSCYWGLGICFLDTWCSFDYWERNIDSFRTMDCFIPMKDIRKSGLLSLTKKASRHWNQNVYFQPHLFFELHKSIRGILSLLLFVSAVRQCS